MKPKSLHDLDKISPWYIELAFWRRWKKRINGKDLEYMQNVTEALQAQGDDLFQQIGIASGTNPFNTTLADHVKSLQRIEKLMLDCHRMGMAIALIDLKLERVKASADASANLSVATSHVTKVDREQIDRRTSEAVAMFLVACKADRQITQTEPMRAACRATRDAAVKAFECGYADALTRTIATV